MVDLDIPPGEMFALAEARVGDGRHDEAIDLYLRVADAAPADSAALTRAGHLLLRRDRNREAEQALGRAVARHRNNATAWFLRGEAGEALNDLDIAERAFREVTRLRPDLALAHRRLGALLRGTGAVAAAIAALQRAARLEPGNPNGHGDLAHALHDAGMTEQAISAFRQQILLEPTDAAAHYNLAVTLPLLGGREAGLRQFRRTVILDPLNGAAWSRIGRLIRRLGLDQETAVGDRRAMVLEPGDQEPLLRLAKTDAMKTQRGRQTVLRHRVLVLAPGNLANRIELADLLVDSGAARRAMVVLWTEANAPNPAEATVRAFRRACRGAGEPVPNWCRSAYQRWIAEQEAPAAVPEAIPTGSGPVISVIMPVCDPPIDVLELAIASVREQSYPHWRLCIADDASRDSEVRRVLEIAAADPRIVVIQRATRGHISAASNSALAAATGDIVCFLDHDDLLAPSALDVVASIFRKHPDAGLVYSDEDKIDENGVRFDPHFKPDWDLDLLLSQNYLCHLMSIRRSLVEAVGGFRVGVEGSQDHDLALRVAERLRPEQIHHIPRILYHWRAAPGSTALGADSKPYAMEATRRVLQDHHDRLGDGATVRTTASGWRARLLPPDPPPLVSVIVPTRDRCELLRRCLDGLTDGTRYPLIEILVVDNGSHEVETRKFLRRVQESGRARIIDAPGDFNFSRLNNLAAVTARGDVLCFINNDVEPLNPDWLDEMVSHATRRAIGVVGAKLLYPDRRIQHGGIVLCGEHVARHLHVGLEADAHGYWGRAVSVQSLAAVTGACMVVRREVFDTIGGFDEEFAVDFGDIDLCLRAGAAGYRTLWSPHAVLLHHESASRGTYFTAAKRTRYQAEREKMVARWGASLDKDPHYNVNLSIDAEDEPFDLAFPPRRWPSDG